MRLTHSTNVGRLGLLLVAFGCASTSAKPPASVANADTLRARARKVLAPLSAVDASAVLPPPPRIELGRRLFFEPAVGIDGKTSCATCHVPERYGAETPAISVGVRGRAHIHNSPTVFNSGLGTSQGWRGQHATLEDQAAEIMVSPVASGNASADEVLQRLRAKGYEPAFRAAFPDEKQPLSAESFGVAIGAFERTLLTPRRSTAFSKGTTRRSRLRRSAG